jgi:DNA-binding transcriptional regulator LsrR (DeoR family)
MAIDLDHHQRNRLDHAWNNVDTAQRALRLAIFELHYDDNVSVTDMAASLGISRSTVHRYLLEAARPAKYLD